MAGLEDSRVHLRNECGGDFLIMTPKELRPAAGGTAERGAVCSPGGERTDHSRCSDDDKPSQQWRAPTRVWADRDEVIESAASLAVLDLPIYPLRPASDQLYPGDTVLHGLWPAHVSDLGLDAQRAAARDLFDANGNANVGFLLEAEKGACAIRCINAAAEAELVARCDLQDIALPPAPRFLDPCGGVWRIFAGGPASGELWPGIELVAGPRVVPAPPSVDAAGRPFVWLRPPRAGDTLLPVPKALRKASERRTLSPSEAEAHIEIVHLDALATELSNVFDLAADKTSEQERRDYWAHAMGAVDAWIDGHAVIYPDLAQDLDAASETLAVDGSEASFGAALRIVLGHLRHDARGNEEHSGPPLETLGLGHVGDVPPLDEVVPGTLAIGHTTLDAGATTAGKTALMVAQLVGIAAGKDTLGEEFRPRERSRVLFVPGEDGADDIRALLHAVALRHGLDAAQLEADGWLHVFAPGRWELARNGLVRHDQVDRLISYVRRHHIGVLVFDPMTSFHTLKEADAGEMDGFVKGVFNRVAREGCCAVLVLHHQRKNGGAEPSLDDIRGSVAVVGAVRGARGITRLSPAEAASFGLEADEASMVRKVVRLKFNHGPSHGTFYFRLEVVRLPAGRDVAVAARWYPPDPYEEVPPAVIAAFQERIRGGRPDGTGWRYSDRVRDIACWAGTALAEILNMDPANARDRTRLRYLIEQQISQGLLVQVDHYVDGKKTAPFVELGRLVET